LAILQPDFVVPDFKGINILFNHNSKKQNPPWDANSFLASREICLVVWNTKLLYYCKLSHDISLRCILILSSHLCHDSQVSIFLQDFPCFCVHPRICHIHTPWSRVFLEKLTGFQLVKKFPAFYGTRRFINTFTRAIWHIPHPFNPSWFCHPNKSW